MIKTKKIEIAKFEPIKLVKLFKQYDKEFNFLVKITDKNFLSKQNRFNVSLNYSDGDIEFWIKNFKTRYYGGSWNNVYEFITEMNGRFNLKINIPPYYNSMIPIVKRYCDQAKWDYEKLLHKYGIKKFSKELIEKEIVEYIDIYQDPNNGGSIPAIRRYLIKTQGYVRGETTIRRSITNFFHQNKYKQYFNRDLSYQEWLEEYKLEYYREEMPLDPKLQSCEYIMIHDTINNMYRRLFIEDLNKRKYHQNLRNYRIFGLSNNIKPIELPINNIQRIQNQNHLEVICKHGSVIVTPEQYLFTMDDDCNIIKLPAHNLKKGTPLLMPRVLKTDVNSDRIDFFECGRQIIDDDKLYIKQDRTTAFRFINKGPIIGETMGQYASEGTMPSLTQPTTKLTSSIDREYVDHLQDRVNELFGLDFHINTNRIIKCKTCKIRTVEVGEYNICPKCKAKYHEAHELYSKSKLAQTIFTRGMNFQHAYSYLKEVTPFIYNAPLRCLKSFILSYFRGDGSKRDYRDEGGSFDLNIETASRRMVFGLNFLMRKLGVIVSVSEHFPPPERRNSKPMYSLIIRGSSNYEILNNFIKNLPETDFSTRDIKTSVNTQKLIRKLNTELQIMHGISLDQLDEMGIVPKNAYHVATQVTRRTNLSEVLLLKTLDGLKKHEYMTPLAHKMERVFRQNTFTEVKQIRKLKKGDFYKITVDGLGYCCGTSFVYVKSEKIIKKKVPSINNFTEIYHDDRCDNRNNSIGCKNEDY